MPAMTEVIQAGTAGDFSYSKTRNLHHRLSSEHMTPGGDCLVKATVLPQDPMISSPAVITLKSGPPENTLSGERFTVVDEEAPPAKPDSKGNFIYSPGDPAFDQVNSSVIARMTLEMLERHAGHALPWRGSHQKLVLKPHSEKDFSHYDHQALSIELASFESGCLGKMIKSAQSADTISHEVGHAVLDGLRPHYMTDWDDETMAFHEAFADITTMLFTLEMEANLEALASETGGDLSRPNRLAKRSEEIGKAQHLSNNDPDDDWRDYVRNAQNSFIYMPPEELPWGTSEDELAAEYHSFSRIFSGAFYDCIRALYEKSLSEASPAESGCHFRAEMVAALRRARDRMGGLLGHILEKLPDKTVRFREVASLLLEAEREHFDGACYDTLRKVLEKRRLIDTMESVMLTAHDTSATKATAYHFSEKGRI